MIRALVVLAIFLFSEFGYLFGGTPVMFIRCRTNKAILFGGDPCDMPGFITYEGHCFPLPVDGVCPSVPGFEYLVPLEVIIDDEPVTICVPDCSESCVEYSCIDEPVWNAVLQACACDDGYSGTSPEDIVECGCPEPLIENPDIYDTRVLDGSGYCTLPEKDCYDLGLDINILPFICDQPDAVDDTIKIIIKRFDGSPFTPFEDAVTIEDLENCDLLDDSGNLLEIVGIFGSADRAAFVADASGCIVIEFTRDPTLPTTISFLSNDPIVIPACPRVFDPCSCRDENITDPDGIVQYWYDELTFNGNPNANISVASNSIPEGFLDPGLVAYSGMIGTTDPSGVLSIPFFRTPGFDTDVSLQDNNSQTASLVSSCTLPVNFCVNIIPTLGEWALIILSLLLLIVSTVSVSMKKEMPSAVTDNHRKEN